MATNSINTNALNRHELVLHECLRHADFDYDFPGYFAHSTESGLNVHIGAYEYTNSAEIQVDLMSEDCSNCIESRTFDAHVESEVHEAIVLALRLLNR